MRPIDDIAEEYDFLDADERYRLLIELGRDLEPMPAALAPFDLRNQLSSNRTQGVPNMIALIRETATRFAAEG